MKTKNLFKIALIIVLICAFTFGFNTTVKATTKLNELDEGFPDITKTDNNDGSYTLTLNGTTSINLEITSGEKVTLDLNGKTLANDSKEGMPTILVDQGAELTIMDSSEGSAYIHRNNVVEGFVGMQPVVRNEGTLTITGGTILPGAQSCYGIENSGKLTISGGGVAVSTEKTYGIFNKENGVVNITDGLFRQGLVPNTTSPDSPLVVNQGTLNITGGTFLNSTGNKVPSIADITGGTASVTGGKFVYQDPENDYAQENQDMSTLIPDNFELDSNGNVVKKVVEEPTEPTKPTEPTEPEEPEKPIEPAKPAEPTDKGNTTVNELDDEPKTGDTLVSNVGILGVLSLVGIVVGKNLLK